MHGYAGAAAVPGEQGERGGEAPAGTISTDGDPVWIDAEGVAVLVDPGGGGVTVLETGGERVLGGESVIDGDDDCVDLGGDLRADDVAAALPTTKAPPWMYSRAGWLRLRPGGVCMRIGTSVSCAGPGTLTCVMVTDGSRRTEPLPAVGHVVEPLPGGGDVGQVSSGQQLHVGQELGVESVFHRVLQVWFKYAVPTAGVARSGPQRVAAVTRRLTR